MPNLRTVRVEIEDFWNAPPIYWTMPVEDGGIARSVYLKALPVFLDSVSSLKSPPALELQQFGSAAWEAFSPVKFFNSPYHGTLLSGIVDLTLTISHRDNMEWAENSDWVSTRSLDRGDRINILLNNMTNLESLQLARAIEWDYVDGPCQGDLRWLNDTLHELHFPKLMHFSLQDLAASPAVLEPFIRRHAASLQSLVLGSLEHMDGDDWSSLLVNLRPHLSLTSASIILETELVRSVLMDIIADQEVVLPESFEVDVGNLWMNRVSLSAVD